MEDYRPNKQSVVESPKEQTVDESQPEHLGGVLQSVGEALQYEKPRQRLIETKQCESSVKAAAERKRKSRHENERRFLEKGGVELVQEYKREESKQTQLRRKKKKRKMMHGSGWKQQEMQL